MPFERQNPLSSSRNGSRQTGQKKLNNFIGLGLLSSGHLYRAKHKLGGTVGSVPDLGGGAGVHARHRFLPEAEPYNKAHDPQAQDRSRPVSSRDHRTGIHFPLHDELGSMIGVTGPKAKRERTFIGTECAVCEEPLEHTLRGERILQLSCGHVAHEACFYEYIKEFEAQECPTCDAPLGIDTSRGGNLNFEKLNTVVRSVQTPDLRDNTKDSPKTPTPWEIDTSRHDARSTYSSMPPMDNHRATYASAPATPLERTHRPAYASAPATPLANNHRSIYSQVSVPSSDKQHHMSMASSFRGSRQGSVQGSTRERQRKHSIESKGHTRNGSGATGGPFSSADFPDAPQPTHGRRHDYDVQAMESSVTNPRGPVKNPIPAPVVTVRSEFPTLSRSRQQQSLTCLITVEVVDGKWRPDPDDIHCPPELLSPEAFDAAPQPPQSPARSHIDFPRDSCAMLERVTEQLRNKVDNWHGLDFARFGKLILHGTIRVGKDRQSWQDLDCYLFTEMLICIKEKKAASSQKWDGAPETPMPRTRCSLKGSILIKRHLQHVQSVPELDVLTLSLSVAELPHFHLQFHDKAQMETWRRALVSIDSLDLSDGEDEHYYNSEEDDYATIASRADRRVSSSAQSSYGAARSTYTAPTDYTSPQNRGLQARLPVSLHVPVDIVVVIPVSCSMQGLKISLLRDVLKFLVSNLGEQDRMGLVTFGSSGGSMPIVGMTSKSWTGWSKVLESIKPVGQKSLRADVVDGANVAMDLLMQRKSSNPISGVLLISDAANSDPEIVDFVVSRAEAAKIAIYSFGLGLTHKPDTMIELSTRTKATYTYVKDWMMLRECVAGCLGAMQSVSHQNAKLKLRLPEGSPAKFVKISGALQITKRATGKDAEASLGDLRFGDRRDILVQLAITPDSTTPEHLPQDPWENLVSGLEALGGSGDSDDMRTVSIEEVPLIQADLGWGDILREGNVSQLPRPSLLAITMLPPAGRKSSMTRSMSPPIPPHPSVVQRRMELLTSDMLTRALTLVSRAQHDRAFHLLTETRTILKGLGKGGLPPLPPPPSARLPPTPTLSPLSAMGGERTPPTDPLPPTPVEPRRTPSPPRSEPAKFTPPAGIDTVTMQALDAELESALEWINHPAVFGRDNRKAVLQAIGVISSQRAFTTRTPIEGLWAARIPGVKNLGDRSREWRDEEDDMLTEEA